MPTTFNWVGGSSTAYSTAGNWSPSGPPGNGDTAIIGASATQALAGSDQSAITLAFLVISPSLAFNIGSAGTPLKIGATAVTIGALGTGSTLTNGVIALSIVGASAISVLGTPTEGAAGLEPVLLETNNSATTLAVSGGLVGLGTIPSSSSTIGSVTASGSGTLDLGGSVTVTGATVNGGVLASASALGTLALNSGDAITQGTWKLTTATLNGGTLYANSRPTSGTAIGTCSLKGGTLDISQISGSFGVDTFDQTSGSIRQFCPGQFQPTAVAIADGGKTTIQVVTR